MWVKGEIFRNLAEAGRNAKGLGRAEQASPFDRLEWFDRIAAHCPPAGTPLIARARADGSDAWLFLSEEGERATAFSSWYTLAFAPVFTGDPGESVRSAMLVAMARRLRKRLSRIVLTPMRGASATLTKRAFERAGWIAVLDETSANWTAQVGGMRFEDYWAARPGELRSTVKRKAAKAEADILISTKFDAQVWAEYEDVYANSWKDDEGSLLFLRDFAEAEGAAGTLRLGVARIAGQAVAGQLWTVEHGTAIIHKLAYREDAAAHSPGTLLTRAMIEHAIDNDRVVTIDFGTGDDAYKRDWMDARAPLFTLRLFNPRRAAGLAGAGRALVARAVKR